MNKEKNFMSAVVYVHNNETEIYDYLGSLISLLDQHFEHSEIICVNDGSTDNSVEQIRKAAAFSKNVVLTVLNLSRFHGLEIAMNAGDEIAIGDYLIEIDSIYPDYPMSTIIDVYKKVQDGYDIVSASSDKKQKITSKIFYCLFQQFSSEQGYTKMQTESFRILSRRAVNRVGTMNKVILYRKTLYENCGLKTARVTYRTIQCKKSQGKDGGHIKYRGSLAIDSLIMYTDFGYSVAKFMTMLMLIISLFMGFRTVYIYISSNPVEGWTTTIMFLAASFSGLFAILMVIVKYLQLILNLSVRRKKYSFESIEKLTK